MTFLPIQFKSRIEKEKYKNLSSEEVLNLIETYLEEKEFGYIKRKKNKIIFYNTQGLTNFTVRSFLFSGIVVIKQEEKYLTIKNGNWLIITLTIPFIIILLAAHSKFSTFDVDDIQIIWKFFGFLFGGNFLIRVLAHYNLKKTILQLIKER